MADTPSLPEQIRQSLVKQGWMAQIVSAADVKDELVPVVKDVGLMKCVDGRESDHEGDAMHGPKTLGGIYAIASMRGVQDDAGLAAIVEEVRKAGYAPSVHGDEGAHTMGCGYFRLWKEGNLPKLDAPNFSGDEGKKAVLDADGKYELLKDAHYETQVVINLVPDTTMVPNHHNQRFVVDGWVLGEFDLDVNRYLELAVSTVEQLSTTCRSARIVVP